jgi:hypothetical protein
MTDAELLKKWGLLPDVTLSPTFNNNETQVKVVNYRFVDSYKVLNTLDGRWLIYPMYDATIYLRRGKYQAAFESKEWGEAWQFPPMRTTHTMINLLGTILRDLEKMKVEPEKWEG